VTDLSKGGSSTGTPVLGPSAGDDARIGKAQPAKIVIGLVGMGVTLWFILNVFLAFGLYPEVFLDSKIVIGVVAVIVGVGGAGLFFFFLNMAVEGLPAKASAALMPYAYIAPGLGLVTLMLLYPTVQTINYAFANKDASAYVGFENFREIFGNENFRQSLVNNVLWLILVPAVTVGVGLVVAVLADKLSQRSEKIAKSSIFLPMAISFVGASAIWSLIYDYSASGNQTGLLNAIWTKFGGEAQTWLQIPDFKLNSMLLMVILVWLQTGFSMILLSSAIKGVPEDTIEAARIDGATEFKIFARVVVPQIKGTIITVFITVTILVLKVFDIVYVMTNGRSESNVIANLFFNELFANSQSGRASAIVVVLLIAVMPVLIYQVRHFRAEEANR
jgi:alpha-glucoside transport system permease protein